MQIVDNQHLDNLSAHLVNNMYYFALKKSLVTDMDNLF